MLALFRHSAATFQILCEFFTAPTGISGQHFIGKSRADEHKALFLAG